MDESRFYDRNKLYEEVCVEAVDRVAKRYGVSGVALAKTCRNLKVPLPGRGYWAKHKVGKAPKRLPLPSMKEPPRICRQRIPARKPDNTEDPKEPKRLRPDVFRDAKRLVDEEKLPENRISVPDMMDTYHPMVELLSAKAEKKRKAIIKKWRDYTRDPKEVVDGLLRMSVRDEHFDRAARIMTALIGALESRGYAVAAEYREYRGNRSFVTIMEQEIPFRLREPSKRREPTKEEKARVSYLRYVDEPSGYLEFELTEHT